MPSSAIIRDQILLAQMSMFCYAGLPVFSEWLIETGKTKVYWSADEVGGWHISIAYMALYLTVVEICVYWMHRTLHTNKFLYKCEASLPSPTLLGFATQAFSHLPSPPLCGLQIRPRAAPQIQQARAPITLGVRRL